MAVVTCMKDADVVKTSQASEQDPFGALQALEQDVAAHCSAVVPVESVDDSLENLVGGAAVGSLVEPRTLCDDLRQAKDHHAQGDQAGLAGNHHLDLVDECKCQDYLQHQHLV